jgi:hypothetical protein
MVKLVPLLLVSVLLVIGCAGGTSTEVSPSATTITFTVPDELPPATVGVPYEYSFATPTNPTGGNPPYSFVLGSGVGFVPFGLILDLNGSLHGTPTAAGTRVFEVCVKDLSGNQACGETSLTVEEAPEVWRGTFEIIGREGQSSVGSNFVQEYHASGEFSFRVLSDDTIEGSGTAEGEYSSSETSGSGDRYEAEASFTTSFSVTGYYYQGAESSIRFTDLSPSEFTLTGTTYWKSGEVNSGYTLSTYPIFYGFTSMGIGMQIADGATDEDTLVWGGMGEICRTVSLSIED